MSPSHGRTFYSSSMLLVALTFFLLALINVSSAADPRISPVTNPEIYPWVKVRLASLDDLTPPTSYSRGVFSSALINFNVYIPETYETFNSKRLIYMQLQPLQIAEVYCSFALPEANTYEMGSTNLYTITGIFNLDFPSELYQKYKNQTRFKVACEFNFAPTSSVVDQPFILGLSYGPISKSRLFPVFPGDVPNITVAENQIDIRRSDVVDPDFPEHIQPQVNVIPIDGMKYPVTISLDLTAAGTYFVYMPTVAAANPFAITDIDCHSDDKRLDMAWTNEYPNVLQMVISAVEGATPLNYHFNCTASFEAKHIFDMRNNFLDPPTDEAPFDQVNSFLFGQIVNGVSIGLNADNFPISRFDLPSGNSTQDLTSFQPLFKFVTPLIMGLTSSSGNLWTDDNLRELKENPGYDLDPNITSDDIYSKTSTLTAEQYTRLEDYEWDLIPDPNVPNVFYYQFYRSSSNTPVALPPIICESAHIMMDGFAYQGSALGHTVNNATSFAVYLGDSLYYGGTDSFFASARYFDSTLFPGTLFPVLAQKWLHSTTLGGAGTPLAFYPWNADGTLSTGAQDFTRPWTILPLYDIDYQLDASASLSLDTNFFQMSADGLSWITHSHLWINGKLITPKNPAAPGKKYSKFTIPRTFSNSNLSRMIPEAPRSFIQFEKLTVAPDGSESYSPLTDSTEIYSNEPIYFHIYWESMIVNTELTDSIAYLKPSIVEFPVVPQTLSFLDQTQTVCPFKFSDTKNSQTVKSGGFFTFQTSPDGVFKVELSQGILDLDGNPQIVPNATPIMTGGMYTIDEVIDCRVPVIPSITSTQRRRVFLQGNPPFLAGSAFIPPILRRTATIGLQESRPFFIKQINFGNFRISQMSSSFSGATFVYKGAQFKEGSFAVRCLNEKYTDTTDAYLGTFTAVTFGRSMLTLDFDEQNLARIRSDSLLHSTMTCSSVPLTILGTNNYEGIQITGMPQTVPIIESSALPRTYALKVTTKVTPGRVSTITFSATLSVPGVMLMQPPYAIDNIPDAYCRTSMGEELSKISYILPPNGVSGLLKDFPQFADFCARDGDWTGENSLCENEFGHIMMWNNTGVSYSDIANPQTCTFVAQRRYSTPPTAKLIGLLNFPDANIIPEKDKLQGYTASVLFPAIGYLPSVADISVQLSNDKTVQIIDETQVDYIPKDSMFLTFYNVDIIVGSSLKITHFAPLDEAIDESKVKYLFPVCQMTSEGIVTQFDPTSAPDEEAKKSASYFYIKSSVIPESVTTDPETITPKQYQFDLIFNKALPVQDRLDCSVMIAYSAKGVKRPQTAVATGDLGRGAYTGYVYLPPVTSQYDFVFSQPDIVVDTTTKSGSFSIEVTNTGKPVSNNVLYVPMAGIGLVPFSADVYSTFTCFADGVKIPTEYSRELQYTAKIPLPPLSVGIKVTVTCNFLTTQGVLLTTPTTTIIASIYENDSGQYGLQTATAKYSPISSQTTVPAIVMQIYNDPKLSNVNISSAISKLIALFTNPNQSLWDQFTAYDDYSLFQDKRVVFEKLLSSDITIFRRQAYQHRVTSMDDPLNNPANSNNIASLPDITTISIKVTADFSAKDLDDLIMLLDFNKFWWQEMNAFTLTQLQLLPYNPNPYAAIRTLPITFSHVWPATCFIGNRCGSGCPQLCLETEPCHSDFDCASNYCPTTNTPDNKAFFCAIKNYSIYPENFLINYNVKK